LIDYEKCLYLFPQQQEVELHEELSRLKTERLTKESHVSRLETTLSEKTDQLAQLQNKLRKVCLLLTSHFFDFLSH